MKISLLPIATTLCLPSAVLENSNPLTMGDNTRAISLDNPALRGSVTTVARELFSQNVHPGYLSCRTGLEGREITSSQIEIDNYKINLPMHSSVCNELIPQTYSMIPPKLLKEIDEESKTDTKGRALSNEKDAFSIGFNPNKDINYLWASEFLFSRDFIKQTTSEIEQSLLGAHKLLFQNIENLTIEPGTYRDQMIAIFDDHTNQYEYIHKQKTKLNKSERIRFEEMQLVDIPKNLSPEERKLYEKVFPIIPPNPSEIPSLVKEFAIDLQKLQQDPEISVYELAAFAHQKIAKIHPFEDGNGRVARLVMQTILLQAGLEPVIFLSDQEYTKKTSLGDSTKGVKAFAKYLEKLSGQPLNIS